MEIFEVDSEVLAMGHLESRGFKVSKLEENSNLQCDLLVRDDADSYLIEVKKREISQAAEEALKVDGFYEHPVKPLGYDNLVHKIVHKAVKQLRTTSEKVGVKYKLVWFSVIDRFDNYVNYERVLSTIYGLERIYFEVAKGLNGSKTRRGNVSKGCLYFTHSCFYTYKDLDAVILAHNDGCTILLNNHSASYNTFKSTALFRMFEVDGAYTDPESLTDERFIIADCDADRKNTADVTRYLSEKYGISNIIPFALDEHTKSFTIQQ